MKRRIALLLGLACVFSMTGCSGSYPAKAADGMEWDQDWTILGTVLGVEIPGNGLTLSENPVVLTGDDTYYATWTVGEATTYVNKDGKDADLYDAELYLLLYGCQDSAAAEDLVSDWIERERTVYTVTDTITVTCNAQEYTFLLYQVMSDSNPYSRGVVAFGVYNDYAVSAELTCVDSFDGDERQILEEFLNGCHYSSDVEK